jgi:hypothetical protein
MPYKAAVQRAITQERREISRKTIPKNSEKEKNGM